MGIQIFLLVIICLMLISLLVSIVENNQVRLFSARWYRIGLPVYLNKLDVPVVQTTLLTKDVYTKDEGVFYFADDGNIYFRFFKTGQYRALRTPFPFKCTATFINMEMLEITARVPLGATIFLCGIILIGILFTLVPGSPGIPFIVISVVVFLFCYHVEKKRLRLMLAELKRLLATGGR